MFHVIQRSHCDFKSVIFEDGFEIFTVSKIEKENFPEAEQTANMCSTF